MCVLENAVHAKYTVKNFILLRSRQTDTENMKHNAQWTEVKQNRLYIFLAQKKRYAMAYEFNE